MIVKVTARREAAQGEVTFHFQKAPTRAFSNDMKTKRRQMRATSLGRIGTPQPTARPSVQRVQFGVVWTDQVIDEYRSLMAVQRDIMREMFK